MPNGLLWRTECQNPNPERTAMAIYPTPQQIEHRAAGLESQWLIAATEE